MSAYTGINCSYGGSAITTFDGSHGIIINEFHHAGKTNKQAQTYAISHGNSTALPFVEYPNKPITIIGTVVGTSVADYESQVDICNSLLAGQNQPFVVDYAGGSLNRQYYGTFTNVDVTPGQFPNNGTLNATLTTTRGFGQDVNTTSLLSASGRTSSSYSDSVTIGGTAPFQLPTITITYSAIGSAPVSGTVTVANGATGQTIAVTRTWAATDVLVIDSTMSTTTPVTVNGNAVEFSGAFPDFAGPTGGATSTTGTLIYYDTFASRTFAISANYYRYFL